MKKIRNWDNYEYSTYMYLYTKDEKYQDLANKIENVLCSNDNDSYRDG